MAVRCALLASVVTLALNCGAGELRAAVEARVSALLKELSADDFDARAKAEKELKKQGAGALPVLRSALEKCDEPELKLRLGRIVALLAIDAENDADKLMALAEDAACRERFETAARGYKRAEERLREMANATKDTTTFAEMRVKEADARRRRNLIEMIEKSDRRLGAALAVVYSKLKREASAADNSKDIELEIRDVTDIKTQGATLDDVIREMIGVCSGGGAAHSLEEQNGKLIVMTVPSMHALIAEFLKELRARNRGAGN